MEEGIFLSPEWDEVFRFTTSHGQKIGLCRLDVFLNLQIFYLGFFSLVRWGQDKSQKYISESLFTALGGEPQLFSYER